MEENNSLMGKINNISRLEKILKLYSIADISALVGASAGYVSAFGLSSSDEELALPLSVSLFLIGCANSYMFIDFKNKKEQIKDEIYNAYCDLYESNDSFTNKFILRKNLHK